MTGLVPSYTIIPLYPISPLISLVVGILLNQRQSYVSNMVEQSCMVSPLFPSLPPLMLHVWSVYLQTGSFWGLLLVANLPAPRSAFGCLPCTTCRLSSEESPTEFFTLGHAGRGQPIWSVENMGKFGVTITTILKTEIWGSPKMGVPPNHPF